MAVCGFKKRRMTVTADRVVASALGMERRDVIACANQGRMLDLPNYPIIQRPLIPLELSNELQYTSELMLELVNRFQESPFFLDNVQVKDISRYTDKYNEIQREKLEADFSRLPTEVCWRHERVECTMAKKKKVDYDVTEVIEQKLMKLEQAEKQDDNVDGAEAICDVEDDSDGTEEAPASNLVSDEDCVEEENDYCATYFDNGEGYGDLESDENIDGDEF